MKSEDVKSLGLFIIQSLGSGDVQTGSILQEEVLKYKKFQEPDFSSELHDVPDKKALFGLLTELNERIKADHYFPILHLETHGYEDGIQLASGEKAEWTELMPYFRAINISLGNQLIVMLALCLGISIIGMIMPDERAPFNAMVGATKDVSQIDIRNGFESFYNTYFFGFNFEAALDAMNATIGGEKPLFHVMSASHMFDEMMNADRSPAFFEQMVTLHAVEAKASHPQMRKLPFKMVRFLIERKIRKIFKDAIKEKDYFMMKDLL
jgi:hypothetical protein